MQEFYIELVQTTGTSAKRLCVILQPWRFVSESQQESWFEGWFVSKWEDQPLSEVINEKWKAGAFSSKEYEFVRLVKPSEITPPNLKGATRFIEL